MAELIVTSTPEKALVFSNHIYVNDANTALFTVQKGQLDAYVQLKDQNGMVFVVRPHKGVAPNEIALSSIQRESCKLSSNSQVRVAPWLAPADGSANLLTMKIEVDIIANRRATLSAAELEPFVLQFFSKQVFSHYQVFAADFNGLSLKFCVINLSAAVPVQKNNNAGAVVVHTDAADEGAITRFVDRGVLMPNTSLEIVAANNKLITFKATEKKHADLFNPKFKFADMGIGGLDAEFGMLFRRSFASRLFPPELVAKLGIKHVKGMLLYGPPGTGKTLIARQIGKMLAAREPKVVNGPEILNKFVGASEENIRKLFADAEADYKENKEAADLHIIIFDEIDAICKARGRGGDSTGVHDTVVNQLLSKIDGVDSPNNILVIGMTNRKDMIDPALLRPGRLEVHIEIGLPDEAGRTQIFKIHLKKMIDNNILDPAVKPEKLASLTKNFSGAEIEGLVKSAASFALYASMNVTKGDLVARPPPDMKNLRVTMDHFEAALEEVHAAFGVDEDELKTYTRGPLLSYGDEFDKIMSTIRTFINQVRESKDTPLLSLLLEGPSGSGKTAISCALALESKFPYVKIISPEQFVGFMESKKCNDIAKIFEDAYKSPLSLIILDQIERLLEYVSVGPRFSATVLQTLLVLVNRLPPHENRKLMIIGTTSSSELLEGLEITKAFQVIQKVNALTKQSQVRKVLEASSIRIEGAEADRESIMNELVKTCYLPIPIKQLLLVIEMAKQGHEAFTPARFRACLASCGFDVASTSSSSLPSKFYSDSKPTANVQRKIGGRRNFEDEDDDQSPVEDE